MGDKGTPAAEVSRVCRLLWDDQLGFQFCIAKLTTLGITAAYSHDLLSPW